MLLFVVGIVLVVSMIVGGYLLERKRRDKLMQAALLRGWTYVGEDSSLVHRWPASRSVTVTARAPTTCSPVPSPAGRSPPSTTATRHTPPTPRATAAPRRTAGRSASCRCPGGWGTSRSCRSRRWTGWPAPWACGRHQPGERGVQPAVPRRGGQPEARQRHPDAAHDAVPDLRRRRSLAHLRVGPGRLRGGQPRPLRDRAHLRCAASGSGRHPELRVEGRWWHREWISPGP